MIHNHVFNELFGYLASVLVAGSLMMSSFVKLRVINLAGALCFTLYGFILNDFPVALVNAFIAIVDLYYLLSILTSKEYFDVLEISKDSDYLNHFLTFHEKDIRKFLPSFSFQLKGDLLTFFILRDLIPAGLVCAEIKKDNNLFIKLDYAIPGYRDFKTGKYAISKLFKEKNIREIYSDPGNKVHEKYLKRLGFSKDHLNGKPVYRLGTS